MVVRENTEGEYAQVGGLLYTGGPQEVAMQTAMFTRHGTERVIRFAFDLARRRNRKRLLTSVTKSNAQGFSMAFWDRVFTEVARDYPDIRTESLLVDAACMDLVRRPQDFDVMVGVEPVRRHPDRPQRGDHRQPGPRAEREPESVEGVPLDVRAGARLGAGHRGPRHRQSDGDDARRDR